MNFPKRLHKKLLEREDTNALRNLSDQNTLVDFSSNDYLGFSTSKEIFKKSHQYIVDNDLQQNGATGSRLLSGNHQLHEQVEQDLATFFNTESALLFNSGYDANIGLFSAILQRGDLIFYDELIHASIRDGIQMSHSQSFKFRHNDFEDLEQKMIRQARYDKRSHTEPVEVYVVTESVFSMDGDSPDLITLSNVCKKYKAHLIVDEAHAIGVLGENGCGLVKELKLEKEIFATVVTFGKAMGCHGAVVLGSEKMRTYLINFARSFIYTTAIPLHSVATIKSAFDQLVILNDSEESQINILQNNIQYFNEKVKSFPLGEMSVGQRGFIESNSAIHCCIIPGNEKVKQIAVQLQENGFDVKPILSPTVKEDQERLRICLHAFNSEKEIYNLFQILATIK